MHMTFFDSVDASLDLAHRRGKKTNTALPLCCPSCPSMKEMEPQERLPAETDPLIPPPTPGGFPIPYLIGAMLARL